MRVLLTTQPAYGHFRPLLPLAHALQAAGHEVRVGTSASFAPVVQSEGFHPEPVGLDWLEGDKSTIPPELKAPPETDTIATVFNASTYELPFSPSIQAGLYDAPVDLLMTVGPNVDPGVLGDQRAGAHVAGYVSRRAVLGRCAVVIRHGGYGTLLETVDAAVPLIVVPFGADQYINAATVERLGIGSVINEEAMTPQVTRAAVDRLIDEGSQHRQRIEALRDAWRALPGPDEAVAVVLELAG